VQDRTRPRVARERRSAVATLAKSDAAVADPGAKAHRILRRVLVDGRHLGSSRASFFHEWLVTVALAATSRRKARKGERSAKATPTFRERG
jgi:hypothetical protein